MRKLEYVAAANKDPITQAMDSLAEARELAHRVNRVVSNLIGSPPGEPSSATQPFCSGLFGSLANRAEQARRALTIAHEELDRLGRALPDAVEIDEGDRG